MDALRDVRWSKSLVAICVVVVGRRLDTHSDDHLGSYKRLKPLFVGRTGGSIKLRETRSIDQLASYSDDVVNPV